MNSTYKYNNIRSIPLVILLAILLTNWLKHLFPIHFVILICSIIFMFIGKITIAETFHNRFTFKKCVIFQNIKVHHSEIKSIKIDYDTVIIYRCNGNVLKFSLSLFEEDRKEEFKEYLLSINYHND